LTEPCLNALGKFEIASNDIDAKFGIRNGAG